MRKLIITLALGVAVLGFTAGVPSKAEAGGRYGQAVVYTNPYLSTFYNNSGYSSYYVNPSYSTYYSYPGYGTSMYTISPARAAIGYGPTGYRYMYTPGYFYSTYNPW